jgi:predicted AAA+ superfamily ATPase
MIRRYLADLISGSLRNFPVVLLTGPRQVGKSTLAKSLIGPSWNARYLTLDDRNILDAALRDPDGLLAGQEGPVVVDEVQRAPDLIRAIKKNVDEDRRPGRFLLTGSAHVLTLERVTESLAGRIALHSLFPFAWGEKLGRPASSILDLLVVSETAADLVRVLPQRIEGTRKSEIITDILTGGFPPVFLMNDVRARSDWFASYRQTYLERDLFQIRAVEHIPDFNRLLTLAALRTGRTANLADLARDCGLSYSTLRRYINLLEITDQIFFLPPYHAHPGKRLVKTPKLFFQDTGMAAYYAGLDDWETAEKHNYAGALVETWAVSEIRKLAGLADRRLHLYFRRTQTGEEVDLLVERAGRLAAVEIKWGSRIDDAAVHTLEKSLTDLEAAARIGVILYGGSEVVALSRRIVAVPFRVFFEADDPAFRGSSSGR